MRGGNVKMIFYAYRDFFRKNTIQILDFVEVQPVAGGGSLCSRNWCRLARLSKLF